MENSIIHKYANKIYITIIIGYIIYYLPLWLDMLPKFKVYTAHELTERHGLKIEEHTVTTYDEFILTHHRLINPTQDHNKKVVILNHGVMDKSNIWIAFTQERSLGYYLFNRGYDVWLLNTRGNSISNEHKIYTNEDSEYWKFSFHEIGVYDLSSSIDYILNVTNVSTIDFVGFSMGSTSLFALFNENPAYNMKIRKMVALAPAVYEVHVAEAFPFPRLFNLLLQVLKVLPQSIYSEMQMSGIRCEEDNYLSALSCYLLTSLMSKAVSKSVNVKEYRTAVPYLFGSGSIKSLLHFHQTMVSGVFQQFDFGVLENLEKYGSEQPPVYDLSKCTVPLAIFSSKSDSVCQPRGIQRLLKMLPNIKKIHEITEDGFNHNAFFSALNTTALINRRVYEFLNE